MNPATKQLCHNFISYWNISHSRDREAISPSDIAVSAENSGERTRLACGRWRPRHRELLLL